MFGNALLWMLDKEALVPQFNTQISGSRLFGNTTSTPVSLCVPVDND